MIFLAGQVSVGEVLFLPLVMREDPLKNLDMRVGVILCVEDHQNDEKLFTLKGISFFLGFFSIS